MNELQNATAPKSDQLDYDDLPNGQSKTITITKVVNKGGTEQPVSVYYEGDGGRPYRPNKSMIRVMVHVWGGVLANYIGKRMTVYGDPSVTYGGMAVGGLKISHVSGIEEDQTILLTAKRGMKKPFVVKPLKAAAAPEKAKATTAEPELSADARSAIVMLKTCPANDMDDWGTKFATMGFTEVELKAIRVAYSDRKKELKACP